MGLLIGGFDGWVAGWVLMVANRWGDGWVLILGRWVGSGGWLGLDEIGGWVGSGRRSGGQIIFRFATVGLRFAHRRFAIMDLGFACRGSGLARLGFFFFFFWVCSVMIFYKPHGAGWILMWDRQNVGFGDC